MNDEYIRPTEITKRYHMSRTTVWAYMCKMACIPKYGKSIIRPSKRITLVKAKDWQEFLESQDLSYLKG